MIPPRDPAGCVLPHNDPEISDVSDLIRHIHPQYPLVFDENTGQQRISSAAFSPSSVPGGGMSVDLEQKLSAAGLPSGAFVPQGMGAVRLNTGRVRALILDVGSDPTPKSPCHGQVWGIRNSSRQKLRRLAEWVTRPDGI